MNVEIKTDIGVTACIWSWLKGFPKRHKVITTLAVLYVIFKLITTPIVNPFASDVYTIRGRFPFDQGFTLSFRQYAYGSAPWFKRWCGFPFYEDGTCAGGSHWLEPTRIGENHYELKVYRDRYFSGLGGWKEVTYFGAYLTSAAADRDKMLFTIYTNDESSVCDDSEEFLKKYKGQLFCTSQSRHKDFKNLTLTDGLPTKSNERLINFWLERELTPMLEKHKQGAKP